MVLMGAVTPWIKTSYVMCVLLSAIEPGRKWRAQLNRELDILNKQLLCYAMFGHLEF